MAAADALFGLAQARNAPVVSDQEGPPGAAVVGIARVVADVALVDTLVVVGEDAGDVHSVGAGHTVLAGGAVDEREPLELFGDVVEQGDLLFGERRERAERGKIVLKVLHIGHTAEHGEHLREAAAVAERPRGDAALRLAGQQAGVGAVVEGGQPAAEQRFHYHDGDVPLLQFVIHIFGLVVVAARRLFPVGIVHLDLHEIPVVFLVEREDVIEGLPVAVHRIAEVPDAAGLAFPEQEIQHAVLDEASVEALRAGFAAARYADVVQQVVVDVVHLQAAARSVVHLECGGLGERGPGVREFGGDVIGLARMAFERDAGDGLGAAFLVGRGGVKIVDPVLEGIIDQTVDGLLVQFRLFALLSGQGRPAHTAVAQQGDVVAVRSFAVGHPALGSGFGGGEERLLGRAEGRCGRNGGGADTEALQEFPPVEGMFLCFHRLFLLHLRMDFVADDIDGAVRAGRAVVFAGAASDAAFPVDGRHPVRGTRLAGYHRDGAGGAVAGTVSAGVPVGEHDAVFRNPFGVADPDGTLLLGRDRQDGSGGTDLGTGRAGGPAEPFEVGNLRLHQRARCGGGPENVGRALGDAKLAGDALV